MILKIYNSSDQNLKDINLKLMIIKKIQKLYLKVILKITIVV